MSNNKFFELAKKNYGNNWNKAMLKNLVEIQRLTEAEYKKITGEDYEA